jgi:hypothetical protein
MTIRPETRASAHQKRRSAGGKTPNSVGNHILFPISPLIPTYGRGSTAEGGLHDTDFGGEQWRGDSDHVLRGACTIY